MKSESIKYNIGLLSAMPEELGLTLIKLDNFIKKFYGSLGILELLMISSLMEEKLIALKTYFIL